MALAEQRSEDIAPAERRLSPRQQMRLASEVQAADGRTGPATLKQLSQTGFLMESATPLATGELFSLQLPHSNKVFARVIWSCGTTFGCEFQRRISSAALSAAALKSLPTERADTEASMLDLESGQGLAEPGGTRRLQVGLIVGVSGALWSLFALAAI